MAKTLTVSYGYHVDLESDECINESFNIQTYEEACKIIDQYPWQFELDYFDVHGESQGIYISTEGSQDIEIQIVPVDANQVYVFLDIVVESGFLEIFGGKKVSKTYDSISFTDVKQILRDVFILNLEQFYQKYSDKESIVQ